jgi:hypothetical protein
VIVSLPLESATAERLVKENPDMACLFLDAAKSACAGIAIATSNWCRLAWLFTAAAICEGACKVSEKSHASLHQLEVAIAMPAQADFAALQARLDELRAQSAREHARSARQ